MTSEVVTIHREGFKFRVDKQTMQALQNQVRSVDSESGQNNFFNERYTIKDRIPLPIYYIYMLCVCMQYTRM